MEGVMSAAEFIMTFIMPYIPLLALIIGLWIFFIGSKESCEQKWSEELAAAKPYTDEQKSNTSISRENFHILSRYLLYFIIIIPILVHFLGKIKYGPNMPYTSFLVIVGIPFLIAFIHISAKVDHQRNRLMLSGISKENASIHVAKWMALAPGMMIFVIYIILKLANAFM